MGYELQGFTGLSDCWEWYVGSEGRSIQTCNMERLMKLRVLSLRLERGCQRCIFPEREEPSRPAVPDNAALV